MTETENMTVETNDTPTIDLETDITFAALIEAARAEIKTYKDVNAQWVAASGDESAKVKAFKESDDERAVKFRERIAELTANFEAYARESIVTETLDEATKAKLNAAHNEARAQVSNILRGMETMAKSLDKIKSEDYSGAFKAWREVNDPLKGKGTGGGSNLPKVPVNIVVTVPGTDGNPPVEHPFENFGTAAKWLATDTETLQKAVAKAAGLAHSELIKFTGTQTFPWQRGTLTLSVAVSPKETNRGRKPAPAGQPEAEDAPVSE